MFIKALGRDEFTRVSSMTPPLCRKGDTLSTFHTMSSLLWSFRGLSLLPSNRLNKSTLFQLSSPFLISISWLDVESISGNSG